MTGVLKAKVGGVWVPISMAGPQGPPGPAGSGSAYTHNQGSPSATWVIVHNLGVRPNVTVEDSAGTTVEGEIEHNSENQLTLTFSGAFSGIAYLS